MINKFIRNFIAKRVAGRSDDGIMISLRDPQKVEFQSAMMQDLLMRNGIDPNAIQSEQQLKMILNQISTINQPTSGIRGTESAKVFNRMGEELDPNQPIIGGTQPGKSIDTDTFSRLAETNTQRMKQKIADKKVRTEEDIKADLEAQNKDSVQRLKDKMDDPEKKADGGRIGYKIGAGKKGVQGLLDLVRKKFGKKSIKVLENEPDFSLNILNDFNIPRPESAVIRDKMKNFGKPGKFNKDGSIDYDYYAEILNDSENTFVYGDETIEELEKMAKARLDEIAEYKAMYDRGELDKYAPSKLDNVNDEQIAAAVDDIFPTGDPKYDAEMASEALVENNPQIFGDGVLLDDLDDSTRSKIYGAVYDVLSNNMVKMRELKKATKPEKTLKSMKEGKGINMSDPEIAEEFTRFMKETDPEGYKKLEQTVELSNFKTKGRKKNATGGRAGFFMGSRPATQKGLATLRQMLNYFGKKSDRVKNPSDILKIVNPKQFNKMLEDPNIYRKFDVEKGIAAPDLIKNVQKQMMMDRKKTIEEMLGAAKNIKKLDDDTLKYKNNMIEDMMKKGVDRKMAEEMSETISDLAKGAAGKFDDTPKLTDEGVLQLENILKDMETGGKKARDLNADGGRIGLKAGMTKRAFLKLMGGVGAGIAGLKSGVIGLGGKQAGKEVAKEVVKSSSGKPPAYFFNLVNKIKTKGEDVTEKAATQEREIVTEYKDYRLTEDLGTGRQTIQKTKLDTNEQYYDETLAEQTYMDYIPGKSLSDESTGKVADEYIEDTSYLRTSGPQKGEVLDVVDGVPEEVIEEGTMFEDNMTDFGKIKKASGGIARMLGE